MSLSQLEHGIILERGRSFDLAELELAEIIKLVSHICTRMKMQILAT